MSCNGIEPLLQKYLEGELAPEEREIVEKHVETCDGCREELDELRSLTHLLSSVEEEPVPSDFLQGVRSKLEARRTFRERISVLWARPLRVSHSFGILAIIVVFLGFFVWMNLRELGPGVDKELSLESKPSPERIAMVEKRAEESSEAFYGRKGITTGVELDGITEGVYSDEKGVAAGGGPILNGPFAGGTGRDKRSHDLFSENKKIALKKETSRDYGEADLVTEPGTPGEGKLGQRGWINKKSDVTADDLITDEAREKGEADTLAVAESLERQSRRMDRDVSIRNAETEEETEEAASTPAKSKEQVPAVIAGVQKAGRGGEADNMEKRRRESAEAGEKESLSELAMDRDKDVGGFSDAAEGQAKTNVLVVGAGFGSRKAGETGQELSYDKLRIDVPIKNYKEDLRAVNAIIEQEQGTVIRSSYGYEQSDLNGKEQSIVVKADKKHFNSLYKKLSAHNREPERKLSKTEAKQAVAVPRNLTIIILMEEESE